MMDDSPNGMRDKETYAVLGAAFEVHSVLGPGFLEPVYCEALAREFVLRGIPYGSEVPLEVSYKGAALSQHYRADFVCFRNVLLEIKALPRLTDRESAQIINYLTATRMGRGLLLNFGTQSLQFRRFVGPEYVMKPGPSVKPLDARSQDARSAITGSTFAARRAGA